MKFRAAFRSALAALRARSAGLWAELGFGTRLVPLLLLTLPAVVQAEDFTYTTDDGTITITGYTGLGGAVTIPDTITGLPVTSIGDYAFQYNTNLTSVTIDNNVTNIGEFAFSSCTSLTSVTIGTNVISIGDVTFQLCTSLTSVAIGSGVTSIGAGAFSYCRSLTSVTIPDSVTDIGNAAFQYCGSLTAIKVDALNPAYSSVDGVLFDKSQATLIQFPGGKAGNYAIPSSVTTIWYSAFANATCLASVTIPHSVITIEGEAFSSCSILMAITVDALSSAYSSVDGVLFNKSQTSLIQYPGGKVGIYTIPDSVTNIWGFAFYTCAGLTSVTVGNGVTNIGVYAFAFCPKLTGVYFQGNAPKVDGGVLYDDTLATAYYLPGTTGWGASFGDRPAALWLPEARTSDADFGVRMNQFGFNIHWASDKVVVVEASSDFSNPVWTPLSTNTLTGGSSYFSDPQWTNHPTRYYRLVSLVQ